MEVLIVALILGLLPAAIASSKGRSFFGWYIYGVFLFIIAIIHSILLQKNENTPGMKKCPHCASIIPEEAKTCPACQQKVERQSFFSESDGGENFYDQERNLESISYQKYLSKKYDLQRDELLNKYIVEDRGFETLEEAFKQLHDVDLTRYKEPKRIIATGKIGPNYSFNYEAYANGKVLVKSPRGETKLFNSLDEAKRNMRPS